MGSNWFNILKIKTPDGAWLINSAEDFEQWKERLQVLLEKVVLQEFRGSSTRLTERSRVRVTQNPKGNYRTRHLESDEKLYHVSFRHPFTEVSCSLDFIFKENPDADNLYYVKVIGENLGPNFVYNIDYVVGNEGAFLEEISNRVGEYMETSKPQGGGKIPELEEGRKTQAQINEELARENPGYFMIEGSMRDRAWISREVAKRKISLESFLAQNNITMEQYSTGMPPPPPPPPQEKPRENRVNTQRENLRRNRGRVGPLRRRRNPPPREEE